MLNSCFSIEQIKFLLEKRLQHSIYKIEPFINDILMDFTLENDDSDVYWWDFDKLSLLDIEPINTLKNPIYYGKIFAKVKTNVAVSESRYRFYMRNNVIKSLGIDLTYNYINSDGGLSLFDYQVNTGASVNNPLPADFSQHNYTPENSANLVFSDYLKIYTFTDGTGTFSVSVHVFFEGYRLYFR